MMRLSWRNVAIFGTVLLLPQTALACPLCSLAVISGLGLSRYLMVDDVISGNAFGLQTVLVNSGSLDAYGAQPTHHLSSLEPLLRRFTKPYWER
jgi:hypothetical protein